MSSDREHELTRIKRQERVAELRGQLDRLRGQRAKSHDPKTRTRLDGRIRILEARISRA